MKKTILFSHLYLVWASYFITYDITFKKEKK